MKFGQMIRAHRRETDLFVSARHDQWLKANPNASYPREAIDFAVAQLRSQQRDRTKAWSASSIGGCARAAQFQWLGMPQKGITDTKTVSIFHNGDFMHLRWQMAGISAGWLAQAEVFKRNDDWQIKGTLDGICTDGRGLELKSINSFGFKQVIQHGGKKEHLEQIDAYFLMCPDIDKFSLIYECKDTQEWTEIVVPRESSRIRKMESKLLNLNAHMREHTLIDMRDDCWREEGYLWRSCPYSPICRDAEFKVE